MSRRFGTAFYAVSAKYAQLLYYVRLVIFESHGFYRTPAYTFVTVLTLGVFRKNYFLHRNLQPPFNPVKPATNIPCARPHSKTRFPCFRLIMEKTRQSDAPRLAAGFPLFHRLSIFQKALFLCPFDLGTSIR
jgi:hypothetical protein